MQNYTINLLSTIMSRKYYDIFIKCRLLKGVFQQMKFSHCFMGNIHHRNSPITIQDHPKPLALNLSVDEDNHQ